jgi:uncharacterized repeat protein (TIGR01451 family)
MDRKSKLRRWLAPLAAGVALAGGALVVGGTTLVQAVGPAPTDLTITKVADAASVAPGSPIGFTITVTNPGADNQDHVVVEDPLPGGSGVSWAVDTSSATTWPAGDCAITGTAHQSLICAGGGAGYTLDANSSVAVHVTSATTADSCGTYSNIAFFGDDFDHGGTVNGFPFDNDRAASASTTVNCLTIAKTPDAATVDAGSTIGFTITVTNPGPGEAKDVTLADNLPAGYGVNWSVDTGDSSGPADCWVHGGAPNQSVECNPFDLSAGSSEILDVTSSTDDVSCGTYDNTVTYSGKYGHIEGGVVNGGGEDDRDTLSGSASASLTVACLTITKTADATSVSAGSPIGFTVTLTDVGDGAADNVSLTDPLPTGSGVSWSIANKSGPLTCAITSGSLTCTGTLDPSDSEVVHMTSPTTVASCDPYSNTASYTAAYTLYVAPPEGVVNAEEPDGLSLSGSAHATATVTCPGASPTSSVLAASTPSTGAGPTSSVSLLGIVLLVLGGFALVVAVVTERRIRGGRTNIENI